MTRYRVLLLAATGLALIALDGLVSPGPVRADPPAAARFRAAALNAQNARATATRNQDKKDQSDIAKAWVAAWNSHNANAVAALFTADGVYEDVPTFAVNHGTAQIHDFAQFFFTAIPDLKIELVNSHIKGGHGTIEWIFSGTDKGIYMTGKKFSVRGVTVLDLKGNKISRDSDYWDLATVLRELGLLPPGL